MGFGVGLAANRTAKSPKPIAVFAIPSAFAVTSEAIRAPIQQQTLAVLKKMFPEPGNCYILKQAGLVRLRYGRKETEATPLGGGV
jgi:hypothetical protein